MAYWITLKKAEVRRGFSAATSQDALAILDAKLADGFEEVRIIHPDGYEVSAYALRLAADAKKDDVEQVEAVRMNV